MRKSIIGATFACLAVVSFNVNAALIDRGNGLIYDDDLDITWMQDANYAQTSGYDADGKMNWQDALDWAAQLEFGGFTDWQLPSTPSSDANCTTQSSSVSYGSNCTGSEMGHLYYSESVRVPSSIFSNISNAGGVSRDGGYYWSSATFGDHSLSAYVFSFINNGDQTSDAKTLELHTWAVHDGDIGAVPIPSAVWLFASGLIGLIGFARRKA